MKADPRLLGRFWLYLRPHARWLWISLFLMPLGVVCQLAGPLIIKYAIDEHLLTGSVSMLRWDVLAFLGVLVGEYVARAGERFALIRCGVLTLKDLRYAMMERLTDQPMEMFERRPLGSLVGRVTSDVEALMETLSTGVVTIVSDFLVLVGIVIVMVWLNLHLTVVIVAMAIPLALVVNWYRRRLREDYDRVRQHTSRMNGILNETITGAREMQLFNYQSAMQNRFGKINAAYFRDNMRIVSFDAALYSLVEAMGILTIAVMAWYGIRLVIGGIVTIGLLVAFLTYIHRFYTPIKEFSSKMAVLQGGLSALSRVVDLLDHDEHLPWGARSARGIKPSVRFEGVWFVYPQRLADMRYDVSAPIPSVSSDGAATEDVLYHDGQLPIGEMPRSLMETSLREGLYALRDVSFSVKPAERVAIVGWTGSGKSTVVKLLAGLYRPIRGRILVDGNPIEAYDKRAFQRQVGLVHQDTHLFADTIAFNIGLGYPEISRSAIEDACRIVRLDSFIRKMPRGYDTIIEAAGRNLSQGQRQLLGFARILAWSPRLVILDEATSSVDSRSEQLIQEAILEVLRRKTTIVIAHRLTTIQNVDRILVFHEGRLMESGTHEALLAQGGYYYDLVEAQFAAGTR